MTEERINSIFAELGAIARRRETLSRAYGATDAGRAELRDLAERRDALRSEAHELIEAYWVEDEQRSEPQASPPFDFDAWSEARADRLRADIEQKEALGDSIHRD